MTYNKHLYKTHLSGVESRSKSDYSQTYIPVGNKKLTTWQRGGTRLYHTFTHGYHCALMFVYFFIKLTHI